MTYPTVIKIVHAGQTADWLHNADQQNAPPFVNLFFFTTWSTRTVHVSNPMDHLQEDK